MAEIITWFVMAVIFIFGIIIGSFLNVVVLRHGTGKGLGGRSICFNCKKVLQWYELVPVVSYVWLNGKCSKCRSKISVQYPLVELATGLLYLVAFLWAYPVWLASGWWVFLITLLILWDAISLLVVIFVYDLYHQIIPNLWVWSFIGLAVINTAWHFFLDPNTTVLWLNLIAAALLTAPFALIWLLSKGKWFGFGDVKLILGIGLWLGVYGFTAVTLAFWIGTLVIIAVAIFDRAKIKHGLAIPFAPFLVAGFLLVLFLGWDFFRSEIVVNLISNNY